MAPFGHVLVAANAGPGRALFYTSRDFRGFLDEAAIEELRAYLLSRFGLTAALRTCSQVHGDRLATAEGGSAPWCEEASCDAIWTDRREVALGIKVADCLPVSLSDPVSSTLANIHAGWRGAAAPIVTNTLRSLAGNGFDVTAATAWLGPSIRACCFEVGDEVVAAMSAAHGNINRFVDRSRGPRPYLDLAGVVTEELLRAGFSSDSIFDCGICTRCDERFHSYRRGRENAGRNLAVLAQ